MKDGFILTIYLYPLEKSQKILDQFYFSNPENEKEVEIIENILQYANTFTHFAEYEKETSSASIELILKKYYKKYENYPFIQKRREQYKQENPLKQLARNCVIVKLKKKRKGITYLGDTTHFIFLDDYEKTIIYLNVLTYLAFEEDYFLNHTFLIPEYFDFTSFYEVNYESRVIRNLFHKYMHQIADQTVSREKEDFEKLSFQDVFKKLKQYKKFISMDDEMFLYIANNLEVYRTCYDEKMRIVLLVSLVELMIAHKPDSLRFHIEDSIKKQFINKMLLILHLNQKEEKETEKLLSHIYDIRSAIAHGNFSDLKLLYPKITKWIQENDLNFMKENGDAEDCLFYIDRFLYNTFRILLRHYLKDPQLFLLLKK